MNNYLLIPSFNSKLSAIETIITNREQRTDTYFYVQRPDINNRLIH